MRLFCIISFVVLLSCKESTSVNHIGPLASVTMGAENACGLTSDGVAYCWGTNATGGLGDGTVAASRVPVAVAGSLRFATISAAARFVCGVATTSNGYCWGFNADGNLGIGTTDGPSQCSTLDPRTNQPSWCSTVPIAVTGGVAFSSIRAGGLGTVVFPNDDAFACGIAVGGAAYCWGGNGYGELGDSSQTDRSAPTLVAGVLSFPRCRRSQFLDRDCAQLSRLWPSEHGSAYCWGENQFGQLGDSSLSDSRVPIQVAGGHVFTHLSAGGNSTCGVTIDGAAYCWGDDVAGQLGDGGSSQKSYSVPIAGVP